jgi:superfamily II DNA or RNA helicase
VDYGLLRDYQKDFSNSVARDFNHGHKRVVAVMATGGGKTVSFGHIAKRYLDKNPTRVVVVISHLGLLIGQTGDSFNKFWNIDSEVLQASTIPSKNAKCVLTTMQSFKDLVKLTQWGGYRNIGLVIVDEAHRMFNESYDHIFSMMPDDYRLLGVTATPFKDNQLLTGQFDKVSYTISTQELIDMGHLVKPVLKFVPFDKDNTETIMRQIIEVYKANHKGDKAIVYMKRASDCVDMKRIMDSQGIRSMVVTGTVTGSTRDKILSDYKKDEVDSADILLTVDVLTAGFDSPNIKAIFMPYVTKSVSAYLQRIGRGLRPDAGKDHCSVYIGGKSPELMKKEWERIQKKALNVGKRATQDVFEELEYNSDFMTSEELVANKRLADMARRVRAMNMNGLCESIASSEIPAYLMDALDGCIRATPKSNSKIPATAPQKALLNSFGIVRPMTKKEASLLIDAHKRSRGWLPEKYELVPSGRFKDREWKNVPHIYIKYLANDTGKGSLYSHYLLWKDKIKGE